jgi:hypothetical protein
MRRELFALQDDNGDRLPTRGRQRVALCALLDAAMIYGEGAAMMFTGVKVFSATKARDREALGDVVTAWLRDPAQRGVEVVRHDVTQSSDAGFHCLAVTLFYRRAAERCRCADGGPGSYEGPLRGCPVHGDAGAEQGPRRVRRNGGAA